MGPEGTGEGRKGLSFSTFSAHKILDKKSPTKEGLSVHAFSLSF
jgi:hypothetical protein